jgi:hypothetical protein
MFLQPFEPAQLVIEFRARRRIAVRQIETSDDQAIDFRFDIAAVRIIGIARQTAADQRRLAGSLQDRYPVPGFFAMPDGAIAGIADRCRREFLVRRLQLLQARDIRRGVLEPIKQIGEASVDAVDVVRRDAHASSSPQRELSPRRYLEYDTIGNPNPNNRPPAGSCRAAALTQLVDAAPDGDDWLHELKYDGYRSGSTVAP